MRLRHRTGAIHYINLLSIGFTADVATLRARRFSGWGELGYFVSIFLTLARFRRRAFPVRIKGEAEFDRRPVPVSDFQQQQVHGRNYDDCSKSTNRRRLGGLRTLGPIGRLGLIRNLPGLYDGTHIQHPLAECQAVSHVEFDLDAPVDVMVDGEVLTLECQELDVLPRALNVVA